MVRLSDIAGSFRIWFVWRLILEMKVGRKSYGNYSLLWTLRNKSPLNIHPYFCYLVAMVWRLSSVQLCLTWPSGNREAIRELAGQRASQLLDQNREKQDTRVNERRKPPRVFHENDLVFVHKNCQSVGKLDSGMRGPYKVVRALPHAQYELKYISGSLG